MELIRKPNVCLRVGRTWWFSSLLENHVKEELASTSGVERRRESAALSLSKEEGKKGSVCVSSWIDVCQTGERAGWGEPWVRAGLGRGEAEQDWLLGVEEVGGCSNGERICLNQGNGK